MTVEKNNKLDTLNQQLQIAGERLIDYSDNSNNEFQEIREQVFIFIHINFTYYFNQCNTKLKILFLLNSY